MSDICWTDAEVESRLVEALEQQRKERSKNPDYHLDKLVGKKVMIWFHNGEGCEAKLIAFDKDNLVIQKSNINIVNRKYVCIIAGNRNE